MSQKPDKNLNIYANLMDEVRARIAHVNLATSGRAGFATPIIREFCYLQIRMLCELVALGCLVAHGDIAGLQSHKVGRSYSAQDILARLTDLRPHFYPVAVKQTMLGSTPTGNKHHGLEGINPSPFPKEALLELYGKTHKYLHRGSLRKILSSNTPLELNANVPEIIEQLNKMIALLNHHIIAIDENNVMICILSNIDNNGSVQVIRAGRPPIS
jgi:hypothetical protein